jgi:hypothetical protein
MYLRGFPQGLVPVCHSCGGAWGAGGKYLYLRFRDSGEMGGGETVAIALPEGKERPELPPSGFHSIDEVKEWTAKIDMTGKTIFAPDPTRLCMPTLRQRSRGISSASRWDRASVSGSVTAQSAGSPITFG